MSAPLRRYQLRGGLATLDGVYTTRLLPREEWDRLAGTDLETLAPQLDPEHTRIVVVEGPDGLAACWAATRFVHLEGVWIAPQHRKSPGVVRKLLRGMRWALQVMGASYAITGSTTPDVASLIEKLGGRPLHVNWAVLPMQEETKCPLL
jgi:hypothetical protein